MANHQGGRIVFGTGNRNFTVFRRLRVFDQKVRRGGEEKVDCCLFSERSDFDGK